MDIEVTNNRSAKRFETTMDDALAVLEYELEDGVLTLVHTGVPSVLEGKGIGGRLVKAALEFASEQGLKVVPLCPFVRSYIERHKEYQRLL
jgi:predicted GNAT family acetyltransferase